MCQLLRDWFLVICFAFDALITFLRYKLNSYLPTWIRFYIREILLFSPFDALTSEVKQSIISESIKSIRYKWTILIDSWYSYNHHLIHDPRAAFYQSILRRLLNKLFYWNISKVRIYTFNPAHLYKDFFIIDLVEIILKHTKIRKFKLLYICLPLQTSDLSHLCSSHPFQLLR